MSYWLDETPLRAYCPGHCEPAENYRDYSTQFALWEMVYKNPMLKPQTSQLPPRPPPIRTRSSPRRDPLSPRRRARTNQNPRPKDVLPQMRPERK